MIILATKSPYRKLAIEKMGMDCICDGSNVNENIAIRPNDPIELVKFLARIKAENVAQRHDKDIIISFDSIGYFNGQILEKVKSRQEDFERLKQLSGKTHDFYTGIHMINQDNGKTLTDYAHTKIFFRKLTDNEINKALDQNKDELYKKYASGYDIQNTLSASFAERIEGSFHNIMDGLPLEKIVVMLKEIEK